MRIFSSGGKLDTAVGKMRGAGYEAIPQRVAILRALAAERHRSLEEIKAQCPEVGLVTVYWALDIPGSLGIVRRLDLGDGVRYEPAEKHHHHVICQSCGNISEFKDNPLDPELLPFGNESELRSHSLEVYGKRAGCR